jgi:hypothetical protein
MQYNQESSVAYNISWEKTSQVSTQLSGTVTISNPTATPIAVSAVQMEVQLSGRRGDASGAVPFFAAECPGANIAAGKSMVCSFATTIRGTARGGTITASAAIPGATGSRSSAVSSPSQFSIVTPSGDAAGVDTCVEIIAGLMLGSALLMPGGTRAIEPVTFKACDAGSRIITQQIGPLPNDACGKYTVRPDDVAHTHAHCTGSC